MASVSYWLTLQPSVTAAMVGMAFSSEGASDVYMGDASILKQFDCVVNRRAVTAHGSRMNA